MNRYGHGIILFFLFLFCIAGMAWANKPEANRVNDGRKPAAVTFVPGSFICGRIPASGDEIYVSQEDGAGKKIETLFSSGNDGRVSLFLNTYCDKSASINSGPVNGELHICCVKKAN